MRALFEGRASFGDNRGTARQHYKRFAKAGWPGFTLDPEAEDEPPEPGEGGQFEHLTIWHRDIRRRQQRGQHFEPIELQAILTYEHFLAKLGIEMTAFDWDMIFRIDDIWQDCVPKSPEEIRAAAVAAKRAKKLH